MSAKEIAEKARQNGLHPNTVKYRLKNGEPLESAISRPQKPGRTRKNPPRVKGETLKRYSVFGQSLTLREISEFYGIKYDSIYYHAIVRGNPIESVIEKMTARKTADFVFGLLTSMPEHEKQKLLEMIKASLI